VAAGDVEPKQDESPSQAYLSDAPIPLGDDDPFAHHDLASALGTTLSETSPPFTVGLFGDWGSGKSSVLLDLPRHLGEDCAFVTFDAWRYDGDTLRRNFLRELALALAKEDQLSPRYGRAYDPDRELRDLDVDVQTIGRVRLTAPSAHLIQALWAAVVFALLAFVALQFDSVHDALIGDNKTRAAPITAAVAIVSFAASYLVRLVQATPETVSRRRVEDPERFAALYVSLLKRLTVSRLLVAIDNLDRCSPERAVEVLSTIKTYLEPAREQTGKDVVFLIAVDIDALRRHLLAQELEDREDREGAERYVDEYLRKFFNAHLRIDAPAPDDMIRYVAGELAKVRLGGELREADRKRLVQVLATGLRHNPRRIKQFLNNLELRLRLIKQREAVQPAGPPAIVQTISVHVLVIAKLAIIEEEHNAAFRAIVRRPLLLRDWEARAVEVRPVTAPAPGAPPPPMDLSDALLEGERGAALLAFLRVTADITVPDVRPFLRYKQSNEEREVPNYWELRGAAISGAREQLASLLEAEKDPAAFAAVLPTIFRDELLAGNPAGARSVVDVLLSVPGLGGAPDQRRELLSEALRDPAFNAELRRLPPSPLLEASQALSDPVLFGRAVDGVIAGLIDATATSRLESAQALAAHMTVIQAPQRDGLVEALEQPDVADDLSAVSVLLSADAGLLTAGLLRVLVAKLQTGPDGVRQIVGDDGLVDALKSALDTGLLAGFPDQLVAALPAGLGLQTQSDPVERTRVFAGIRALGRAAADAQPSSLDQLVTSISGSLTPLAAEERARFADWLLEISGGAEDGARNAVVGNTVSQALSSDGLGIGWVERNLTRLRSLSPAALADQLQTAAYSRREDRGTLVAWALDADPAPDSSDRAQTIAQQFASQGDIAGLRELLELPNVDLEAGKPALTQTLSGAWANFTPEAQIQAIDLLFDWLGGPDHAALFTSLLSMIETGLNSANSDVARIAAKSAVRLRADARARPLPDGVQFVGLPKAVETLVEGALARAEGAPVGSGPAAGIVEGLRTDPSLLAPDEQERLARLEGRG
jgi:hypothetical protein